MAARKRSPRGGGRLKGNRGGAFPTRVPPWALGIGVAVLVVAAGSWFLLRGTAPQTPTMYLPPYVRTASADVREAYTYALGHPEVLQHIPCYCGCGEHSGHQSNLSCFIESVAGSEVSFDSHGYG